MIPRKSTINVRPEGARIVILVDEKCVMNIDYRLAETLGISLIRQSKIAAETANAVKIIKDQAFLIRVGEPFALTNHPDILKEAANEAAHDRTLRKMFPGGIKTSVQFGVPRIVSRSRR